jgi:hypothetical protein
MQLTVNAHELRERTGALEVATQQATRWAAERQALTMELSQRFRYGQSNAEPP